MAQYSPIEWTHHTFNPWQGCSKVSPECAHCYAEAFDNRRLHTKTRHWGKNAPRLLRSDAYWRKPEAWNQWAAKAGQRHRVFCASLADVFEDRAVLIPPRERLWQLIERTPMLDWLLLTKRPQNIRTMIPPNWLGEPRHNVWFGTSVGVRDRLQVIDQLRSLPAAVKFLSVEPLLEDLGKLDLDGINWAIVGGESGAGARPMKADWVRAVREQCIEQRVPFFFKQWGKLANNPDPRDRTAKKKVRKARGGKAKGRKKKGSNAKGGRILDGRTWDEFPVVTIKSAYSAA